MAMLEIFNINLIIISTLSFYKKNIFEKIFYKHYYELFLKTVD